MAPPNHNTLQPQVVMDGHATKRQSLVFLVLIFILLRTLFALVWDVAIASASGDCYMFADAVFNYLGVSSPELALCDPDFNSFAGIGDEPESFLILDMGLTKEIIDGPGVDFYYYERSYPPGILLDRVVVSVAQDDGTGNPTSFVEVFIWGDENPENNGVLPPSYLPEESNKPINSSDLHNTTGIGIDIGNGDAAAYRFVRFQTYPIDAMPASDQMAEVDAIERIHTPPSPTSTLTPISIETPSVTLTPTPSETPFEASTETGISTEIPTETLTEVVEPTESETSTATLVEAYTLTVTFTETNTLMAVFTATETQTSILTPTSTPVPTLANILTATYTPKPTFTSIITSTPIATLTSRPRPTKTSTNMITATYTSSPTFTVTNTFVPTATQTILPLPTKTLIDTPVYTPSNTLGVSGKTLTPTITRTPIKRFTPTPPKTYTPTIAQVSTATYTPIITFTLAPKITSASTLTWTPASMFTIVATYTPTVTPMARCPLGLDCPGILTNLVSEAIAWIGASLLIMVVVFLMARLKWFDRFVRRFVRAGTIPNDNLSDKPKGQDGPGDKSIPDETEGVDEPSQNNESGVSLIIFVILGIVSAIGLVVGFLPWIVYNGFNLSKEKRKK